MLEGNELVVIESKKKRFIIIPIIGTCILLLLFSTIFSFININNNNIIKGVSINGVTIQGLQIEEAKEKLSKLYNIEEKEIILTSGEYRFLLKLKDIGTKIEINDAIEKAYEVGRNNNIFINNYLILQTMISKRNIELAINIDNKKFEKLVKKINSNIPDKVEEVSYNIEGDELIIKTGEAGLSVNKEKLKEDIKLAILRNGQEINIELEEKQPDPIDIEKIYANIHKEPQNAYFDNEIREIIYEQDGISFNIEDAKQVLKEEKEEYRIKLAITKASVTIYNLPMEAFPDLLATHRTPILSSDANRTYNLNLAAELVNGTVVAPGEVFSYNRIWEAIPESEWMLAPIYTGSGIALGSAGGICQLSTTIYNAILYSNLEIVMRSNHMYTVGYEAIGRDAAVSDGEGDFRFRNSRNMPIKVMSRVENGEVIVEIYGIKEDMDKYEIEIYSYQTGTIWYQTTYKNDSSLAPGSQVIERYGANGATSVTYKRTKLNGEIIKEELISEDYYSPMNQIIRVR